MWFLLPFLITLLVIVSLLLVVIVLMQRPKSEGLGAAFGGGVTDNLFGVQTTNVLSRFTVWLGGFFFLLTLLISIVQVKSSSGPTAIQKQLLKNAPLATAPKTLPSATPEASTQATPSPTVEASPAATVSPSVAPVTTPSVMPKASSKKSKKNGQKSKE
ncbi:MAG: preprotein translocase subunit SecG [Verrucomicrobia bacterium RIFCSPHIGHO2_12_FULL_41_10]|nr:MAG: preprotein translocase subunit SecG [Verrucomicrobia bacterium RIFCSPHIGHO2_12_FULL_41_10]HLB34444.1 preprotein translocase subunit SecG [Chthoniobacterales bacterium]